MEHKMANRRFNGLLWIVLAILVVALPLAACSSDNTGSNDAGGVMTGG
jgi:hypothetical protein